jgi:hypothetical protein
MHYEINYKKQFPRGGDAARRQAINDLINFVGKKRTAILIRWARRPEADRDHFLFIASFAGVQGFPVHALWAYASGRDHDKALL